MNARRALGRVLVPVLCWGALAGCQPGAVRPDAGADATGELGTLKTASPADVYIELADAYMKERNYAEALKNAKKATRADPGNSNSFNVLGIVYQQLGERAQAERAYQRAIQLDPRDPYALNAYGAFLCVDKRYAEADGLFARAVQNPLYQTPWMALTNAGICAHDAGELAKGEAYLRQALQVNKRFGPALLRMARISLEADNALSARAYLQRYAEVAPHNAESLWLGIQTERILGDRDQAASYSLLLRSRFPDSEQVQLLNASRPR